MATWQIVEDSIWTVLGRVEVDGANLTQSDVTSIAYSIYRCHSDVVVVDAVSLTVSDVIFNTLQTTMWTEDVTGYNFKHEVADTVITDATSRYEVEYRFVLNDANARKFTWRLKDPITVRSVKSS